MREARSTEEEEQGTESGAAWLRAPHSLYASSPTRYVMHRQRAPAASCEHIFIPSHHITLGATECTLGLL